jgi:hypothetical protein
MNGTMHIGAIAVAGLIVGVVGKFLPQKIDPRYKTAAKNQETWDYCVRINGNLLIIHSIFCIIAFVSLLAFDLDFFDDTLRSVLGMAVEIIGVVVVAIIAHIKTVKFGKKQDVAKAEF